MIYRCATPLKTCRRCQLRWFPRKTLRGSWLVTSAGTTVRSGNLNFMLSDPQWSCGLSLAHGWWRLWVVTGEF